GPVILGKMSAVRGRSARAGHARLGVDHDIRRRIEQAALRERQQGEERGGRITAGAGNQRSVFDGVAVMLDESIGDSRRERLRRWIPTMALGVVSDPKRTGQIDDAYAGLDERGAELR